MDKRTRKGSVGKMKKNLQLANLIGFALTVALNILANTLPINGISTGEVSALYPTFFTPAGITFAIWGVIYLLLGLFVIYQARDLLTTRKMDMPFLYKIGWWFAISSMLNIFWILAWHYQQILLSLIIMLALLSSLIIIYTRLGTGKNLKSSLDRFIVHVPFSIYLGWITIATVANISVYLVHINWIQGGLGEVIWTVAVIIISTAIALMVYVTRRDLFYIGVVLWAFMGIIIKRLSVPTEPRWLIIFTIVICVIVIITVVFLRLKNKKYLSNVR